MAPSLNTQSKVHWPHLDAAGIKSLDGKLSDPGFQTTIKRLASDAEKHFSRHSFDQKSIGMLLSSAVMSQKRPDRILKLLEELLYGKADTAGVVVKSLLIGQSEFVRRLSRLNELTLHS